MTTPPPGRTVIYNSSRPTPESNLAYCFDLTPSDATNVYAAFHNTRQYVQALAEKPRGASHYSQIFHQSTVDQFSRCRSVVPPTPLGEQRFIDFKMHFL